MRLCVLIFVPASFAVAAAVAPRTPPSRAPADDPYLSSTDYLAPGIQPDPIHNLDTVRSTWWDLPPETKRHVPAGSPVQRVIYRDTVTGAEVWLIRRGPGSEFAGFYSTQHNFNADGSMLEIDRFLMEVDGSGALPLDNLVDRNRDPSGVRRFLWDPDDPDVGWCERFSGRVLRFHLRTREEIPVFEPDADLPGPAAVIFSYDGSFSLIHSRQSSGPPFLFVGDAYGRPVREITLRSASPDPAQDYLGNMRLYQDRDERYWVVYSLNKAATRAHTDNPHQVWMVDLEDAGFLESTDGDDDAFAAKRRELRLAGRDPLTRALGHAGLSPDERFSIWRRGPFVSIRDLVRDETRVLSYVPTADHLDWSADVPWFLARTRAQPGLPIYRIDVPAGIAHRIVASNTSDHLAAFSYSHPSPDGTKCLFRSSMLGKIDMYMAIVQYPGPPRAVTVQPRGDGLLLAWTPPERAREIKGYRVYRGARSGGPYEPVGADLVKDTHYLDREPGGAAYYVVTSVEHSGLESRMFSSEAALEWGGSVNLFIEAETGRLAFPMREVFIPDSASAAYAVTRAVRDPFWQPVEGEGRVEWDVTLPRSGDYFLWVRVRTPGDMEEAVEFLCDGIPFGAYRGRSPEWRWARVAGPLPLKAGVRSMKGIASAPGVELDKLLLTTDPEAAPRGWGNTPVRPPPPPSAVRAEWDATGTHVLLAWDHDPGPLFHHYQVYKGDSADFPLSQRRLLGSPVTPAFVDPRPADKGTIYYKVAAVDTWGNRSESSAAAGLAVPARPDPVRRLVTLDASHARGGLRWAEDPEAAGGTYVVLDDQARHGYLEIPLDLPPGRYLAWVRARSRGRYQRAQLDFVIGSSETRCSVTGVARGLFDGFLWAWRRVEAHTRGAVPRQAPLWLTVDESPPPLHIRYHGGYVEIDQVLLVDSPHDLPASEAAWFKPEDPFRFPRP